MYPKEVLVVLTDRWADWEAAYATWGINSKEQYTVKTIAVDNQPKVSIGGFRTEIDYSINDYQGFESLAMIILAGSFSWQEGRHDEIADFVRKARSFDIPVAAICGATIFLGKHGFLDNVKHTGDDLEYFQKERGYNGQEHHISAQVAVDKGFITANETAAVDFACEIFRILQIYTEEEIKSQYDYFKNGAVKG